MVIAQFRGYLQTSVKVRDERISHIIHTQTHQLKKDTASQFTQHICRINKSGSLYVLDTNMYNLSSKIIQSPTTINTPLPPSFKVIRHSHLAVIQKHAIHLLDGAISCVLGLEMDKGIALRAIFITYHLQERKT